MKIDFFYVLVQWRKNGWKNDKRLFHWFFKIMPKARLRNISQKYKILINIDYHSFLCLLYVS